MITTAIDLKELYEENFPIIYNFFFYRLLHRENAEDLTAQTFLKAAEHLHTYDPDKAKASTWLQRIAQNTLIDFYRSQKKSVSIDNETIGSALSVSVEEQYEQIVSPGRKALYAALWQLSERDRTLVYHKYFLEESYHEISRQFSINESTLATVLQRAKAKLRESLNGPAVDEWAEQGQLEKT